jgi:hypothetical protein
MGINSTTVQVKKCSAGNHCVNLSLRNKSDGFEWDLIPVYGAAQDEHKHEFLAELVSHASGGETSIF